MKTMNTHKGVGLISIVVLVWCISNYGVVEGANGEVNYNYREALTKSLLYFEAQRSGKLPRSQRVQWRGDSALRDGQGYGINLVGGYYDAGDNVKFNFPMAYSLTMLSWGVLDFHSYFKSSGELPNALAAIKWGTDYLLNSHPQPHLLYAGVGDGDSDHACWERPEDMNTPRNPFKIDDSHPGSDLAAETAAALAAASMVFKYSNPKYSFNLLYHARQLFDFADAKKGKYSDSVPSAHFYSSSGFEDEQLWAAAWLHKATNDRKYRDFLANAPSTGGTRSMFSWDDKYVGAQLLAAKYVLTGEEKKDGNWASYQNQGEAFICNCIQKGSSNVARTPGGLVWFSNWGSLQYSSSSLLAMTVYADYLRSTRNALSCPSGSVQPDQITAFEVDYILGRNPKGMSYMVGFGEKYPVKVHHRGASIVSIKKDRSVVGCKDGYTKWYNSRQANPNVLEGALVGGPGISDDYEDERSDYKQAEPATATVAPFVGVLARFDFN